WLVFPTHLAAIVKAIQAHRIEEELVVIITAIMEWLTIHEVHRQRAEQAGHHFFQGRRIGAMGDTEPFDSQGGNAKTSASLGVGSSMEQRQSRAHKTAALREIAPHPRRPVHGR